MNLIRVRAKFYGDGESSRALLALVGSDGSVVFGADTGITEVQFEAVGEGDPLDEAQNAVERLRALLAEVRSPDETDIFEFKIEAEELVAIGGNLHRRGNLVEREALEKRGLFS